MKIAHREIGPNHPPLVIAEIGINHGGSLPVAMEMVRLAAAAGCEMVKHQTHILEDEMTDEARAIFPPNADVSIWDVMAACAQRPHSAFEILPVLFKRELDLHQLTFAMGEAIAHLHALWLDGDLQRVRQADGVWRFAAA